MHINTSRSRFAAWDADGRMLALIAEGEDDDTDTDTDTEPAERNGNPAPADRTPLDEDPADAPANAVPFTIPVAVLEGWETADGRYIEPGVLGRRALPQTLMAMRRNPDGGWGHDAAVVAGRIDTAERFDAASTINPETGQPYGPGVFAWRLGGYVLGTTDEEVSTLGFIRDRVLRGVSVDISEATSEIEVTEEDEDGWPLAFREIITQGALMGATVCPFAAFPGAYIELDDDGEALVASSTPAAHTPTVQQLRDMGVRSFRLVGGARCAPCEAKEPADTLVASGGGPDAPPAAWFADPELSGPTALTITDDGRVFGHLAAWGVCHTGIGDACVTAPRSATDYGYFHLGAVRTAEGDDLAVGQITLGTGHASRTLGMAPAVEHYDNTGTAVADIRVGEDAHGVWFAGALRPDVNDDDRRAAKAAKLSGDWRRVGTSMELIGLLSVNVPGFPVPRVEAYTAGGAPMSLVAAGAAAVVAADRKTPNTEAAITAAVERALRPFHAERAAAALARIRGALR